MYITCASIPHRSWSTAMRNSGLFVFWTSVWVSLTFTISVFYIGEFLCKKDEVVRAIRYIFIYMYRIYQKE